MTERIPSGTWSRVPKAAIFDTTLSPACLRVLAALGAYANEHGHCTPSVDTVAKRLGLTRRMVQLHLKNLRRAGWITVARQLRGKNGFGFASNSFLLNFTAADIAQGKVRGSQPDRGDNRPASGFGGVQLQGGGAKSDCGAMRNPIVGPVRNPASHKEPIEEPKGQRAQMNHLAPLESRSRAREANNDNRLEIADRDLPMWRRRLGGWAGQGIWREAWGAPPDHPQCELPPGLIAEALAARVKLRTRDGQ